MSFKLIGIGLIVFLIGFFMSLSNLKMAIWGKRATADLMNAWTNKDEATGAHGSYNLCYRFTDDKGQTVNGGERVSESYVFPPGLL